MTQSLMLLEIREFDLSLLLFASKCFVSQGLSALAHRQDELRTISENLAETLGVNRDFFGPIFDLDVVRLQGNLLLELSVKVLGTSRYENAEVVVVVNRFEALGALRTGSFSLDIPVDQNSSIALNDASLDVEITARLPSPVDVSSLFSNLTFDGTLDANFPLSIGVYGANTKLTLAWSDQDIFDNISADFTYELDICDVVDTLKDLLEQVKSQIPRVINESILENYVTIGFNIGKITDPLMTR